MFFSRKVSFSDRCPQGQNYIFWWGNPDEALIVLIKNAKEFQCLLVNHILLDDLFRVQLFWNVKVRM